LIVDEHITDKSFSGTVKQELLEYFSIEAGFGLYGLNALYDRGTTSKKDPNNQALDFLTAEHYKELFTAYCTRNNIPFTHYEQALLPPAQDTLRLHSPRGKQKSFIGQYLRKQKSAKERFTLSMLSLVFLIAFLYMLWPYIPKPLTQEQRTMQSEIISLKQQYNDCQTVLSQMHESIIAPDVLSSRSLQQQSLVCSELKQEHDQLVRRFNRSL
ncbi:MAG: type II secretion system protein M, partial [Actinobacteria bacterium]|nr:type II secretion system protein M [Actinomycetota bacterium]